MPVQCRLCRIVIRPAGSDPRVLSQARSSHRFEGSNEPPFVRQVSFFFFSCSLYERALSCHHTTSLQFKQRRKKSIWSPWRDVDCERVHDSRAVGIGTTSTEVWSTTAFFSRSAAGLRWAHKKKKKKKNALDVSAFFILLDRSARRCHSCKVLQSTMKRTKESEMDGQAELFSFGFSRWRSGNQPEPNPSSSGSSEQIQKPSSSKESTSSPLEEEQRSRGQSVTAPSSIPGFDIGRIGGRRFLYTMLFFTEVVVKMLGSWSRRLWPTGTDLGLKLCWRKELHDVKEMIGHRWMNRQGFLPETFDQDRSKFVHLDTLCKKFSRGKPPDPTFLKSNSPQYPLGYAPVSLWHVWFQDIRVLPVTGPSVSTHFAVVFLFVYFVLTELGQELPPIQLSGTQYACSAHPVRNSITC